MEKEHLLEARDLTFQYGERVVFSDLSLELEKGGITCLLGPNGCGKTTLIDTLLGFHSPVKGVIELGGRNLAEMKAREIARMAAYVPQTHEKHFPYSVADVILMGRTAHLGFFQAPGKEDREMVRDLLEKTGRLSLAERDYRELSGGETQIVLILRALVQESPLIIMDEPTSHLDFKNELVLLEMIHELAESRNRGVLMSTHSPNQALFLANRDLSVRVVLMDESGRLISGTPREILTVENMASFYGIKAVQLKNEEGNLTSLFPLEIIRSQT
ncbi:ABC transporter ATP-binding protein [Spirochaeta isovalerica]|uniref:Iron complex transport system ATP-binding protein n=1 Tax=Spirochaeta isovalerica TaxID=150 RepID=A0A841RAW9_9SPIO|nr:ABC transporter ATP-binding protein [Spirochaeta isovalerica]MBB6480397.1 iron complex transport system ATP-binding protein [Spirochaeta isovalerica]